MRWLDLSNRTYNLSFRLTAPWFIYEYEASNRGGAGQWSNSGLACWNTLYRASLNEA